MNMATIRNKFSGNAVLLIALFEEKGKDMGKYSPKLRILISVMAALLSIMTVLRAQEPSPAPAAAGATPTFLRVFLDGSMSSGDYVRMEIPFVTYVRDRTDADVHVLTTSLYSNSGTEYQIEWIGLGPYTDLHFTLKYFSDRLATEDENREGFVRVLKKGLMPFIARTTVEDQVKITYTAALEKPAAPPSDPWNSWIFSLGLSGSLSGETSYGYESYRGSFSASRTTEALKAGVSWNKSISDSRYTIEGEDYLTSTRSWSSRAWGIWSLGGHWSAGVAANVSASTYGNIKTSFRISPAIEFDIFPYSESTRKEWTILYRLTYNHNRYLEKTIYDKMSEGLWSQSLTVYFEATQPWGSAYGAIYGSHYFHDASKNRLTVDGYFSVRVWKGFSVYASGSFSRIHDQLSLAKGELTKDEILLRLKQLSTTYDYYVSLGVSYSFGSKMSKAVNPRMGNLESY